MRVESSSAEKEPISSQEAKQKLLYYLEDLEPEKLEDYFQVFDIPQSAVKDPEVQAKVDVWLKTLPQVQEQMVSKQVAQRVIGLLNRLFKS